MPLSPPDPDPADPLLGRVLAGTYRLERLLGRGAMGSVYRATHTLLGEPYAVKVLHPELAGEDGVRRRFLQEARALTRFTHRNAVAVRHCGEEDGLVFLAMDLCPGESLETLLAREGALAAPRAVALTTQVLAALAEAHRAGIIHRDLKPANVMVEPAHGSQPETARVLDFGLSRLLEESREVARSRISSLGEVVGTVAYMSPEQALGEDLDGRSDLFSLGVVLYEMVEGRHPFAGSTMASVITNLMQVDRLLVQPGAPLRAGPDLARVLGHALQKDRALRFPDAEAFARALSDVEAGRPVPAPARPRPPASGPSARRALAWGVGLLALALGGVAAGRWLGARGDAEPERLRAEGLSAARTGRPAQAILALERLVASGAATGEDRLALAQARTEVGDPAAESELMAAERALPGDARVHVAWGRYHHSVRHDLARALESFARALARDRGSVAARLARLDLWLDPALRSALLERRERPLVAAENDVQALAASGAPASVVALARSRLLAALSQEPGEPAQERLEEALRQAEAAAAGDPRALSGPEQVARVLLLSAHGERKAGRYAQAVALSRRAVEQLLEARRRLAADPDHQGQRAHEADLVQTCMLTRAYAEDWEGMTADARELGRVAPADAATLSAQADALRRVGALEEVLPLYERLRDIAPDGNVLFNLAFCHQQLALGRLGAGERSAGLSRLEQALAAYDEALTLTPDVAVTLAYRGETRMLLAVWDPPRRAELLERVRADFERAAVRMASGSELREVLYRRAAFRLMEGDVDGATDDARRTLEPDLSPEPSFHARYARCLLMQALRAPAEDAERRESLLTSAREHLRQAEALSVGDPGPARQLGAQLEALTGRLEAAEAAFAPLVAEPPLLEGNRLEDARLWLALVRGARQEGPAAKPCLHALEVRRRQVASGREPSSPEFFEAAAAALEPSGEATRALVASARRLALCVPP